MKLTVVHLEGSKQGLTETLTGQVITVGRDPSNTLSFDPFKDLDVSTRHASISVQGGAVVMQDLGSTNGTYLNGAKVEGAVPLPNGCLLQFGENGPKVQATYNLSDGPGKKTQMIHNLSSKLDDAGLESKKTQKRNLIVAAVVAVLLLCGVGGYMLNASGVAQEKLEGEVGQAKARAEQQKGLAETNNAHKASEAKADWDKALGAMDAAAASEKAGELVKAKAGYKDASAAFQQAGNSASNAALAALQGQLQDASKRAKASREAKEQQDALDRSKLEARNAAMLAAIRQELDSARNTAKLKEALESMDEGDPDQLKSGIDALKKALAALPEGSDERKELEAKLAGMETSLEEMGNVGERLKAAAKAAKPRVVGIRSRVYALPKGQRLETTKIRVTVAEGVGTGFFASSDGKVITAKEVVYPEMFDPEALALRSKLEEKGMQFFREVEVLTSVAGVYTTTYTSDKVSIARKFDDAWEAKQKVTIPFDNTNIEVTVRPHKRGDTDVVVLQIDGVTDAKALELDEGPVPKGTPLVVLGTQKNEKKQTSLFMFEGKAKDGDKVLIMEVPSFGSWIGGPCLNANGKVIGVLITPTIKESQAVHASVFAAAVAPK
jgi:pSer/pThr/pTyr-binding forkhead associated (FHA) protein